MVDSNSAHPDQLRLLEDDAAPVDEEEEIDIPARKGKRKKQGHDREKFRHT